MRGLESYVNNKRSGFPFLNIFIIVLMNLSKSTAVHVAQNAAATVDFGSRFGKSFGELVVGTAVDVTGFL